MRHFNLREQWMRLGPTWHVFWGLSLVQGLWLWWRLQASHEGPLLLELNYSICILSC